MSNRLGLIAIIFLLLLGAACSSSAPKAPVQLLFTTPTSGPVIDQGQSFSVTVQVPDGATVTWNLQPAFGTAKGTPIGTLSNQTATSATYTACAPGTGCLPNQQLSIVATAGTNVASLVVLVNALPTVNATTLFPACPPTGLPPQGTVATVGSYFRTPTPNQFTVSGGVAPFTWSVASGALPAGLSVGLVSPSSTTTATVTGTPSAPGCPASGVTVQVTDATGVTALSTPLYFVVAPGPLSVKFPNYSNGFGGVSYDPTAMNASGGIPPYTWCLNTGGPLPPGMNVQTLPAGASWTLNNGTLCSPPQTSPSVVIYGTPSASDNLQAFNPVFQVTDSQTPYPALGNANLSMNVTAPTTCDPTAASVPFAYLQPGVPHLFQVRGFDSQGPVVILGSFTTQTTQTSGSSQGLIVSGSEDIIRATGSQSGLSIVSGSYFNLSNHGCLTLTNSAGTTTKFKFTLGGCSLGTAAADCSTPTQPSDSSTVCGQQSIGGVVTYFACLPVGRIIEFDDGDGTGTQATGILRTADPSAFSAGASGMYAFGLSGWDSSGGRYAAAGSFSSSSGAFNSVAADINDAGAIQAALTGGSGTLSSIDTNGRATATLSVGTTSLNLVAYVVSGQEILFSTTGTPGTGTPTLSGEAIANSGPFNLTSLQNTHMFHISGLSSPGPDVSIGLFAFDGIGDVSGTVYEDQAGTLSTTTGTGTYAVDASSGRVTFSTPQSGQSLGAHPFAGYIIPASATLTRFNCVNPASCVTGFLVGVSDSTAQAGVLEFQTSANQPPPPFYNSNVAGYYAFAADELLDASAPAVEGYAQAVPSASNTTGGNFFVTQDFSSGNPNYCLFAGISQSCNLLVNSDQLSPGSSYTVNTNGAGTFDGESVAVTNGNVVFYISESPLNLHPSIMVAEQ